VSETLEERRLALEERKQSLEESWPKKWGVVVVGGLATIVAALISATFALLQHDSDLKHQQTDATAKAIEEKSATERAQLEQAVADDRQAVQLYFQYMANDALNDAQRLDKLHLIASVAHNTQLLHDLTLQGISQARLDGDAPSTGARNQASLIADKGQYVFTDFIGYVQYATGDDGAKKTAGSLETAIQTLGISAPAIQGVKAVPNVNEIRIYKPEHRPFAKNLAQLLSRDGFGNYCVAQVPNPSTLPNGVVELWIGKGPFTGTPGGACPG
jgi:hypothetical protein